MRPEARADAEPLAGVGFDLSWLRVVAAPTVVRRRFAPDGRGARPEAAGDLSFGVAGSLQGVDLVSFSRGQLLSQEHSF